MANPGERSTDVACTEDKLIVDSQTAALSLHLWLGIRGF